MIWYQEYIQTKNSNLRNHVVIGNEDAQDLLANDFFGRVKEIKVEYVWFKVKKQQLLCTYNEFLMNNETITKHMDVSSVEYGYLIAEFSDHRERNRIREYHKFMSDLSPSQISKVVSFAIFIRILIVTSS